MTDSEQIAQKLTDEYSAVFVHRRCFQAIAAALREAYAAGVAEPKPEDAT